MIPFRVIVITDWSRPGCLERVRAAVAVDPRRVAVQHRHPGASDRQLWEEGLALRGVIGSGALFVNGRLDLALALDAHLHLTEGSLHPADVRPHLPAGRWLSASWHPPTAPREGVELLLASPVFDPLSKPPDRPALGVEGFRRARASTTTPVFALGGLTPDRVRALGPVDGVAVIGATDRVRELLAALE